MEAIPNLVHRGNVLYSVDHVERLVGGSRGRHNRGEGGADLDQQRELTRVDREHLSRDTSKW